MTAQRHRGVGGGARVPWASSIGWMSQATSLISMSFKIDRFAE
jgi:hypothetical protein